MGALLVAGVLNATYVHGALSRIMWIAWGLVFLRLIWKIVNWSVDYFVVTSERLLLTTGFLTRRVNMMPLTKVTDMSFKRSFAGRLLGYGEFICGMLFPTSADDEDDESPSTAFAEADEL